ncbi:MAG: benzoate-CoA ligase family protein [Alphaproteobacteria bacterium]|nr:benzoate-CoA ligase family protein [Alphaproteobacteria bacterium]
MTFHPPAFPDDFNMADYYVFSNIEAGRGEKTAIYFEGREISYRELSDNVMQVARNLMADGLLPEQRVLVCMQDRPEFAYAWFGALKAGAVVTQINPLLPVTDYEYYLGYVKPQFTFVDEQSLPSLSKALANSRHSNCGDNVIVVGTDSPAYRRFDDWKARKTDAVPWPTKKDDPAVWLFTSGTTGKSKGAVHCHFHFPFSTEVYAKNFIGIGETDVTISGARLFFGYATGTNLMFPFAVGASTVLFREQPTPDVLFKKIEQHRATVFTSVPTLINKMMQAPHETRSQVSSLRFMWSAGEPLPNELHIRWDAAFGVPIIDGIGSAESFHIYISNRPGDIRPGSLGKLVPGYEAKLMDDEGREVAQGNVGTLWLKGDSAALHYHAAYDKSKEHLRGGWIVSGDKFRQDAEGYWYYEGRGDDLLKSGGIYVSPHEVENCLIQHDAVRECCVLGRKDDHGLEKPLALVVLKEGFRASNELEAELIAFAKARLARYKAPHWIRFEDNLLPRNDRDKIDRKRLRKDCASG